MFRFGFISRILAVLIFSAVLGIGRNLFFDKNIPWTQDWSNMLGFVTSLPEMVTFFAIYSLARERGTSHLAEDTQEALDNLAASNMTNTGLSYPLGLLAFLLVGGLAR